MSSMMPSLQCSADFFCPACFCGGTCLMSCVSLLAMLIFCVLLHFQELPSNLQTFRLAVSEADHALQ